MSLDLSVVPFLDVIYNLISSFWPYLAVVVGLPLVFGIFKALQVAARDITW